MTKQKMPIWIKVQQNFDWDKEVYYFEEDCKHSEIACDFYTEIIPYMRSVNTNCQNVRIVFGLSL